VDSTFVNGKAARLKDALRPRKFINADAFTENGRKPIPLLLRQDQAHEALGVGRTTFWNWVQQGHIKQVLLPGGIGEKPLVRYDYAELQRFAAGLQRKSA
jgi:predicted DNA-binding transcriptional regulator AlpA